MSPKNVGRKTKLTKEREKIIKDCLEAGMSYKDVCTCSGITFETFNQWRKTNPQFNTLVEKAELATMQLALKSVKVGMIKDWRSAAWWLERRRPEEYGRKSETPTESKPCLIMNAFDDLDPII